MKYCFCISVDDDVFETLQNSVSGTNLTVDECAVIFILGYCEAVIMGHEPSDTKEKIKKIMKEKVKWR